MYLTHSGRSAADRYCEPDIKEILLKCKITKFHHGIVWYNPAYIAKPTLNTRLAGDKVDSKESRWPSCQSVGLLWGAGWNWPKILYGDTHITDTHLTSYISSFCQEFSIHKFIYTGAWNFSRPQCWCHSKIHAASFRTNTGMLQIGVLPNIHQQNFTK